MKLKSSNSLVKLLNLYLALLLGFVMVNLLVIFNYSSSTSLRFYAFANGGILVVCSVALVIVLHKDFIITMKALEQGLFQIARGNFNHSFAGSTASVLSVHYAKLVTKLKSVTNFAKRIGDADLVETLEVEGEHDTLSTVLVHMRNRLQEIAEEDFKRNWTREGINLFAEIIRREYQSVNALGDVLIRELVKYTHSNQGSLFIVKTRNDDEQYLELLSCYAWERKKHLSKIVEIGEGMVGQVAIEKTAAYFTQLPHDYIKITSGLGMANPNALLIVPLKIEDKVWGVVELASFNVYESYQRDFVGKAAEVIASALRSIQESRHVKELLAKSQEMAEELRTQEEELRQNIEELSATQEAMERKNREVENLLVEANRMNVEMSELNGVMREKESALLLSRSNMKSVVDALPYPLIKTNADFKIESINPATKTVFQFTEEELIHEPITKLLINFRADRIREGTKKREKVALKNGRYTMTELVISKITSDSNSYIFMLEDISEKLKQEQEIIVSLENLQTSKEALLKSEQSIKSIFEAMPNAVITTDRTGIITLTNIATQQIFGFQANELVGESIHKIFNLIQLTKMKANVRRREKAKHKDGRSLMTELTYNQINNHELIFTAMDITMNVKREQELMVALENLEAFKQSLTVPTNN